MTSGLDAAGNITLGFTIPTHRGHWPVHVQDATTPISSSLSLPFAKPQHDPDLNFHSPHGQFFIKGCVQPDQLPAPPHRQLRGWVEGTVATQGQSYPMAIPDVGGLREDA